MKFCKQYDTKIVSNNPVFQIVLLGLKIFFVVGLHRKDYFEKLLEFSTGCTVRLTVFINIIMKAKLLGKGRVSEKSLRRNFNSVSLKIKLASDCIKSFTLKKRNDHPNTNIEQYRKQNLI